MDGIKQEIRLIHRWLKNTDTWYLDVQHPDGEMWELLADEAKSYATEKLSKMGVNALYQRYLKWAKDPILGPDDDYYFTFLSEVAWNLCIYGLRREEKIYFEDSCSCEIIKIL